MLGNEIVLEEKDVPAWLFHSVSRAFVWGVSWEYPEQKHSPGQGGEFVHPVALWPSSSFEPCGFAPVQLLASCRNCKILVLKVTRVFVCGVLGFGFVEFGFLFVWGFWGFVFGMFFCLVLWCVVFCFFHSEILTFLYGSWTYFTFAMFLTFCWESWKTFGDPRHFWLQEASLKKNTKYFQVSEQRRNYHLGSHLLM